MLLKYSTVSLSIVPFSGIILITGVHGEPASSKRRGEDTNGDGWRSFVAKRRINTCPCKGNPQTGSVWGRRSSPGGSRRMPCAECNGFEACTLQSLRESPTSPSLRSQTFPKTIERLDLRIVTVLTAPDSAWLSGSTGSSSASPLNKSYTRSMSVVSGLRDCVCGEGFISSIL